MNIYFNDQASRKISYLKSIATSAFWIYIQSVGFKCRINQCSPYRIPIRLNCDRGTTKQIQSNLAFFFVKILRCQPLPVFLIVDNSPRIASLITFVCNIYVAFFLFWVYFFRLNEGKVCSVNVASSFTWLQRETRSRNPSHDLALMPIIYFFSFFWKEREKKSRMVNDSSPRKQD